MMNSKTSWSIIMPAYNVERYISTAIESVIAQTIPSEFWELIIIDDSSTDKTKSISREYEEKYSNIKVIEIQDGPHWQSYCWQKSLELAKGYCLGFLDSDDYLYPNALEKMSKYYIKNPDVICAWSQNERYDEELKHKKNSGFSEDPYKYGSLIDGMLSDPGVIVSHFLTCKRKKLLDINGFDVSIKTSADRWLALKMDLEGKLGFIDEILHKYRFLRPGSITLTRRAGQIENLSRVINMALDERNDHRRINIVIDSNNFNYKIQVLY